VEVESIDEGRTLWDEEEDQKYIEESRRKQLRKWGKKLLPLKATKVSE
jgi:hypothetical protein